MLALDDPRWKELNHRGWTKGERYHFDPEAPFAPEELAKLLENPSDMERFRSLWPYLCSEGTAWAAAYAAVPYAVELAKRLRPELRFEHLCFVGLVVMCSCPEQGESFAIKPYLTESYQRALAEALPLLAETLVCRHDTTETRYLLATAAALKGHRRVGGVLEHLDCICGRCPKCGEYVYPEELQQAVN
jgi:hypothetical protein